MKIIHPIQHEEAQRHAVRAQIEEITKAQHIDAERFHEFNKARYTDIITKFLYTFTAYDRNAKEDPVCLEYCFLRFRKALEKRVISGDRDSVLAQTAAYLHQKSDSKVFLLLSHGWVYEGSPDEVLQVLGETDSRVMDFYILSTKFQWLAAYCDDGDAMVIYER